MRIKRKQVTFERPLKEPYSLLARDWFRLRIKRKQVTFERPLKEWPEIGILARTAKLSKRFKLLPFRLLTLIVFGVAFDERGTRVVYLQIKLLSWFSERWELSF